MRILLLCALAWSLVQTSFQSLGAEPGRRCDDRPAIIVACGNAFGRCTSAAEVSQMAAVTAGLDIQIVRYDWGGTKWSPALTAGLRELRAVKCQRKLLFAGRSAGAWLAALTGIIGNAQGVGVDGIISFYGPLDLPTLWQRSEWGKTNSPRGPILYLMPWGIQGCTNCNNPFPPGDVWYYDVNDENDPRNEAHMIQARNASPYHYFGPGAPALFATQGSEDGIIGQYRGVSQARRMFEKLGGRPEDELVECQGYAHGYPFNAPCTTQRLRQWICERFGLSHC